MKYTEIKETMEYIVNEWGEDGEKVIERALDERKPMSMDEFLNHCTCCGGNWGGMLLTGIKKLFPKTWHAIPDNMGVNAFSTICSTLYICGVNTREE